MIHELKHHWDVDTPLGCGRAIMIEDTHQDYFWTVVLEDGAVVTFPQNKIRVSRHYSYGVAFTDAQMRGILKKARRR